MSYPNMSDDLQADEDGLLHTEAGKAIWCDIEGCSDQAVSCVPVSENKAHDSTRCLCASHHEAFVIGVQHGRFHEAEHLGLTPSRGAYLDNPSEEG
jgi:hypothetical protein